MHNESMIRQIIEQHKDRMQGHQIYSK